MGRNCNNKIPYVVHGSFRKNIDEIKSAIEKINSTGKTELLAPLDLSVAHEEDGFVLFENEIIEDQYKIEQDYLKKAISLRKLGGFSIFITPDGYIGKSASYEYGIIQNCGVPIYFTEKPKDVPFCVTNRQIKNIDEIVDMINNDSIIPEHNLARYNIYNLPVPTAMVAVGGILRYKNDQRILMAEDGKWNNYRLTVPGTTVKLCETRWQALDRMLYDKFNITGADDVRNIRTSFMKSGDEFSGISDELVFDDRIIDFGYIKKPTNGIKTHMMKKEEIMCCMEKGEVEPNAAELLEYYFSKF